MDIKSESSLNGFVDEHQACVVLFHDESSALSNQIKTLFPEFIDEFPKLGFGVADCSSNPSLAAIAKSTPRVMLFLKGSQWGALFKELSHPGLNVPFLVSKLGELSAAATTPLETRLRALVSQSPIMLFIKGSPERPVCGFSRQIVDLLAKAGVKEYGHFDILQDEEVRQGLKAFSNWPTFPQLYAEGQLVGGVDIVRELSEEGSLKKELHLE